MHILTKKTHEKTRVKGEEKIQFLHFHEMSLQREKPIKNIPAVYCAQERTYLTTHTI